MRQFSFLSEFVDTVRRTLYIRFFAFLSIYVIFSYPVIRANLFYEDDLARSLSGATGWSQVGRPLADSLMLVTSLNAHTITDISPLPHFLSLLEMAVTSTLVSLAIPFRSTWAALPLALVFCNPLYLANLSYRFDVLTMTTAACFSVFSVTLVYVKRELLASSVSVLLLLASMNLYQPATNLYLVFGIFYLLLVTLVAYVGLRAEMSASFISYYSGVYLLVLVLYKSETVLLHLYGYGQRQAAELSYHNLSKVPLNYRDSISYLLGNLGSSSVTAMLLGGAWLGIMAAFLSCFVQPSSLTKANTKTILYVTFLMFIGSVGMFGPLLLLSYPFLEPRVMIGSGAALSCLVSIATICSTRIYLRRLTVAYACLLLYAQMVLSFSYGNAINAQEQFEASLTEHICDDIYTLNTTGAVSVAIRGEEPLAPRAKVAIRNIPILKSLIPRIFRDQWFWSQPQLQNVCESQNIQYVNEVKVDRWAEMIKSGCPSSGILERNQYYIFRRHNEVVVDFNKCTR